jgi:hypothetical protein
VGSNFDDTTERIRKGRLGSSVNSSLAGYAIHAQWMCKQWIDLAGSR